MPAISLESFLADVSAESPSGANLEYDQRFCEMSRLAEGTREQQYGNTIIAASPPDWRAIGQTAVDLAEETRDLRIAVMLIESKTHVEGLSGLAEGLELLRHWVCELWETVHPMLDEADGSDPFVRINSLGRLCESARLPSMIGRMPLVEAPPHVVVTLDDIRWSQGDMHLPAKTDRPTTMEVEAAFLSLPLGDLRQRYESSMKAEAALASTIEFLDERAGKGIWDATAVTRQLCHCTETLKEQLRQRLSASDMGVADVSLEVSGDDPKHSPAVSWDKDGVDQSITSISRIRVDTRDEAAQVIEAATRYFERHEPSSPVPLLLRRAKRLINQDFVEILRDLAPDALVQAKNLGGPDDED